MYILILFSLFSVCEAKEHALKTDYKKFAIDLDKKYLLEIERKFNEAFLPINNSSYTGIHEKYNLDGLKISAVSYKGGKQNGLSTLWRSEQRRDIERHYIRDIERHYINGKLNGLQTEFDADDKKMVTTRPPSSLKK